MPKTPKWSDPVVTIKKGRVEIYRERKATPAEKKADKDATAMCEWVHIDYTTAPPTLTTNQHLCAD